MQVKQLSARAGRAWVTEGWRLFRLQPIGFITLLFVYLFGMLMASMLLSVVSRVVGALIPALSADAIGTIGSLFVAALVPGLSVGFMEACRVAERKQPIYPNLLVKAFFGDRAIARGLLVLGAFYVMALCVILLATSGVDFGMIGPAPDTVPNSAPAATPGAMPGPTPAVTAGAAGAAGAAGLPAGAESGSLAVALLVIAASLLAYLPVAMALWYSPVLVAWHGMTPFKAMFFSVAACWRNRAAFTAYAFIWTGIGFLLPVGIGVILRLVGNASLSVLVVTPLSVVMVTWMYCSFYATYTSVFDDAPDAPAPLPELLPELLPKSPPDPPPP